jgi:hypothetical protein
MRKFDARTFERELVLAGDMPVEEYVRRRAKEEGYEEVHIKLPKRPSPQEMLAMCKLQDEALSSRAPWPKEIHRMLAEFRASHTIHATIGANAAKPKANTRQRADD